MRTALLAGAAIVAFVPHAFADPDPQQVNDKNVIIVTAAPYAVSSDEVPTIVTHVDRDQILRSGGSSISDVLAQEPGMEKAQSMMELDDAFHQMLFRIARKENTYSMLCSMTIHFDRVRSLSLGVVKDSKIIADHQAICEAVAARDAQKAKAIMTEHLGRVKVDEEAIRSAYPQYMKEQTKG